MYFLIMYNQTLLGLSSPGFTFHPAWANSPPGLPSLLLFLLCLWLPQPYQYYMEHCRPDYTPPTWTSFFSCSCCSGIVAASLSSPADLVKARVMNQPFDDHGRPLLYKNSVECLVKTVRNEGFFGLYKGFLPCYIRMVSETDRLHVVLPGLANIDKGEQDSVRVIVI